MKPIFLSILILFSTACKSSKKAVVNNNDVGKSTINSSIVAPMSLKYNALKPKGLLGKEITLVSNRKANYTIVIPGQPTILETTAAKELSTWLFQMTKVRIPVVQENGKSLSSRGKIISLGKTKVFSQSGIKRSSYNLGQEGYAIVQKEDALYIFGGEKRGPVYGVFALLEEDLGCRWYTAKESSFVLPKNTTFRPTTRSEQPAFYLRNVYFRDGISSAFASKNRLNPTTGKNTIPKNFGGNEIIPKGWGGHTFYKLIPSDQYFKSHPEYFAELKGKRNPKGQLCLTNPDVLSLSVKMILKVLSENPTATFISVGQKDGKGFTCKCGACSAVNRSEGAQSGTLIHFVNKVAMRVGKKYPKVKIGTLAYRETNQPPKVKVHPNVYVRLCTDVHAWNSPFIPIRNSTKFSPIINGWKKLTNNILIWDYSANFKNFLHPYPNFDVIASNLAYFKQQGVKGIIIQGNPSNRSIDRSAMRSWVFAKLAWNPTLNVNELIKDFVKNYYGNAAPQILAYNQMINRQWQANHLTHRKDAGALLGDSFEKDALALMDTAERNAENEEIRNRVKVAKLPVLHMKLENGPDSNSDKANSSARVEEYIQISEKFQLTNISEKTRTNEEFINISKIKIKLYDPQKEGLAKSAPTNRPLTKLTLEELDMKLPQKSKRAPVVPRIVEDKKAENGYAIWLPAAVLPTTATVRLANRGLVEGKTYSFKVRVRVDKKGNDGLAFMAGLQIQNPKSLSLKKSFRMADVGNTYRWYTIGNFIYRKDMILLLRPPTKNMQSLQAIYWDKTTIELVK